MNIEDHVKVSRNETRKAKAHLELICPRMSRTTRRTSSHMSIKEENQKIMWAHY